MYSFVARLVALVLTFTAVTAVTAPAQAVGGCPEGSLIYAKIAGQIANGSVDGTVTTAVVYPEASSATGLAMAPDQTIMWSNYMAGQVFMGSCDGTAPMTQVTLPAGADNLFQMTYSLEADLFIAGGQVDGAPALIGISHDGSSSSVIWNGSGGGILGLGVTEDKVYFCNSSIMVGTLNGSTVTDVTTLYTSGTPAFFCDGIAADTNNNILYWADYASTEAGVWKAPLDGSGTPEIHYTKSATGFSPSSLVIDFTQDPVALLWGTDGGSPLGVVKGDIAGTTPIALYSPETGSGGSVNSVAIVPSSPDAANPKSKPTITQVEPSSGPTAGGTSITITGTDFQEGTTVTVGGATCTLTAVTPTSLTCTTAAHAAGAVDVVVTNADEGTVTSAGAYTYVAAPVVKTVGKYLQYVVHFDSLKSNLTAAEKKAIRAMVRKLPGNASSVKVFVTGYVQPLGFNQNDYTLAKARNTQTMKFLKSLGLKGAYKSIVAGRADFSSPRARRSIIQITYQVPKK